MARFRFYTTVRNTPDLLSLYRGKDLGGLADFTRALLRGAADRKRGSVDRDGPVSSDHARPDAMGFLDDLTVVSAPSLDWRAAFVPPQAAGIRASTVVPRDIVPAELIIAYELSNIEDAHAFLRLVADYRGEELDTKGNAILGGGFDPGGSITDQWCPGTGTQAIFGHRRQARRAVRAEELASLGLLGQRVNVVIIDEGLDKAAIPAKNWGGGLDHYIDTDLALPAGSAPHTSHGMMVARSILDLARIPWHRMPALLLNNYTRLEKSSLQHSVSAARRSGNNPV